MHQIVSVVCLPFFMSDLKNLCHVRALQCPFFAEGQFFSQPLAKKVSFPLLSQLPQVHDTIPLRAVNRKV